MRAGIGLLLVAFGGLLVTGRGVGRAVSLADGDIIVDNEGPGCDPGSIELFRAAVPLVEIGAGGLQERPRGSVLDGAHLIVADGRKGLLRIDLGAPGEPVSLIAKNPPYQPRDVALDARGDYVVVDWPTVFMAPPAVYRVERGTGVVSAISAGGLLQGPHGLAIDAAGNYVIADSLAGIIRVAVDGTQTMVHAIDVPYDPTRGLNKPSDVRVDAGGDYVVADLEQALVRIAPDGSLTDLHRGLPFSANDFTTGTGGPRGVDVDLNGDYLLVDERADAIFRVTRSGTVSLVYSGPALCEPADLVVVDTRACVNVDREQDMRRPRLVLRRVNADPTPDNDVLRLKGEILLPPGANFDTAVDPTARAVRVILRAADGSTVFEQSLPTDLYGGGGGAGWIPGRSGWTFKDRREAPASGIVKLTITDRSRREAGLVRVRLSGRGGTYPVGDDVPVGATLVIGDGQLAVCGETAFAAGDCTWSGNRTRLVCR
jgi:sugar lactone lactonase YvrE